MAFTSLSNRRVLIGLLLLLFAMNAVSLNALFIASESQRALFYSVELCSFKKERRYYPERISKLNTVLSQHRGRYFPLEAKDLFFITYFNQHQIALQICQGIIRRLCKRYNTTIGILQSLQLGKSWWEPGDVSREFSSRNYKLDQQKFHWTYETGSRSTRADLSAGEKLILAVLRYF